MQTVDRASHVSRGARLCTRICTRLYIRLALVRLRLHQPADALEQQRVLEPDLLGEQLTEQVGPARRGLRRVLPRGRALLPLGPPSATVRAGGSGLALGLELGFGFGFGFGLG